MTRGPAITVEGDERLAVTMRAAAQDMQHLERAQQEAARTILTRAQGQAPKRTGRLARSLVASSEGDTAEVSTDLVYAGVIHNGWAAHHISAHPFLIPVAHATEPVWRKAYVAEVQADLNQVRGI